LKRSKYSRKERIKALSAVTSKYSKKDIVEALVGAVIIVGFTVVSLFVFSDFWEDNATNISEITNVDAKIVDGMQTIMVDTTFVVENYFPGKNMTLYPKICDRSIGNSDLPHEIPNKNQTLKDLNIIINSFSVKSKYGDESIEPDYRFQNPTKFYELIIPSLSKTTITYDWNYNNTESIEIKDAVRFFLTYSETESPIAFVSGEENLLNSLKGLTNYLMPYLIFAISGLFFAYIIFVYWNSEITDATITLLEFQSKSDAKPNGNKSPLQDEIIKNVETLTNFPNNNSIITRLMFGLGIFIFEYVINNKLTKFHEKISSFNIAPYKKEKLEKSLLEHSTQSFKDFLDFIPELKTISLIIVGFVTSVGISFSWNIGAVLPLLYSAAIYYLFINLGSVILLLHRSTKHILWIIGILIVFSILANLNHFINFLRQLI
jgi:hypothetical protein